MDFVLSVSKNLPRDKLSKNQGLSKPSPVGNGDCFTQISPARDLHASKVMKELS
jgi:hypothetical protein